MTGLGNRRAFKRDVEGVLERVTGGDELMVAMFDLDGFKLYNDTFGHGAGDALLVRLAGSLRSSVTGSATAYRLGGDEFCVLAQMRPGPAKRSTLVGVADRDDPTETQEPDVVAAFTVVASQPVSDTAATV